MTNFANTNESAAGPGPDDRRTIEERIDAVAWDRLFHAYGDGTDTAAHLHALARGAEGDGVADVAAAQAAAVHLGTAIVHQATVWTASPAALELACAILQERAVPDDVAERTLAALEEAGDVTQHDLPEVAPEVSQATLAFIDARLPVADGDLDAFFDETFENPEIADELLRRAAWEVRALAPAVFAACDALERRPALRAAVAACRSAWQS